MAHIPRPPLAVRLFEKSEHHLDIANQIDQRDETDLTRAEWYAKNSISVGHIIVGFACRGIANRLLGMSLNSTQNYLEWEIQSERK